MQVVVILPLFAFLATWAWKGPRIALVAVLFPCLVVLPAYYTWKLPGIPTATFHNYLVGAGMAALVGARLLRGVRPALTDALVLLCALTAVSSEWANADFHEARNLAANVLLLGIAPYLIGRLASRSDGLFVGCISVLVLTGAVVGFISVFEARMGSNPFDFWRARWPVSVPWDGALYRAGIRRCAGPFAHAICAGFYFSMMFPLWAWLMDRRLPQSVGIRWMLGLGLLVGILTTVSRGPMLGTIVTLSIMRLGWSPWRMPLAVCGLILGLAGSVLVADQVKGYLSVSRGEAKTESQETAAYRTEMLQNYIEIVKEEPMQGFGRYQVPVVKGQKSIDNQYLFLTLQYGMPHSVLFLLSLIVPTLLLMARLLVVPVDAPLGRLGWALVGLLVGSAGTLTTVFAGTQTAQILLFMQGAAVTITRRLAMETR